MVMRKDDALDRINVGTGSRSPHVVVSLPAAFTFTKARKLTDMAITRNTVDRLDKPSSYTANKVRRESRHIATAELTPLQSRKRRRHNRDDDQDMQDGPEIMRERTPEPVDKLANATTLYVGNL